MPLPMAWSAIAPRPACWARCLVRRHFAGVVDLENPVADEWPLEGRLLLLDFMNFSSLKIRRRARRMRGSACAHIHE